MKMLLCGTEQSDKDSTEKGRRGLAGPLQQLSIYEKPPFSLDSFKKLALFNVLILIIKIRTILGHTRKYYYKLKCSEFSQMIDTMY